MILNNQQAIFDKAGLGFRSHYKQQSANNLFRKSSKKNLTHHCCGKLGHKIYSCNIRRNPITIKTKQVWVAKKSLVSNIEGSKMTWMPKYA